MGGETKQISLGHVPRRWMTSSPISSSFGACGLSLWTTDFLSSAVHDNLCLLYSIACIYYQNQRVDCSVSLVDLFDASCS